jgi:phage terminase large subunit
MSENPLLEFGRLYAHDTVRWVNEVLPRRVWADKRGQGPFPDQVELFRAYDRKDRRIAKRSGHGVGKTTGAAQICVHHMLFRFPQRTVCTAASAPQLFDALVPEIKSTIQDLPEALRGLFDVQSEAIMLKAAPDKSFMSFKTSKAETPEAMAGVHAENVLLVCDEASGIPDAVYEAGAGSMSGHGATTILLGNPVRTSGLFYDVFHKLRGSWTLFHTSCEGHPNVTPDFMRDMAERYGEDSNAYRVRVLGEFPTGDDDAVIPFELVEAALARDVRPLNVQPIWGIDPARFGSDATAFARRVGNSLERKVEVRKGWDTMQVAGWVKREWDDTEVTKRPSEIIVDVIGIGAGVVDRLGELGLPVRAINVWELPSSQPDRYSNMKAELWFRGREWFAAKDCSLAKDEALMSELVEQTYEYSSNGKMKLRITSKDDMRSKGVKSPNRADAFLLTLASESVSLANGSKHSTNWSTPMRRKIAGIV